ncbi:PTS system trehalose-specific EIIBC component [Lacticaseibacillus absianus]|uniref:PTS system trehalose-specific EIIBC component n=1 Tax=Lacticaseibacillus absianus TaxID=2729623 RepID=UPI0015CC6349|nr:PTS system trehalose-specific EIIBC component [Lacticaseibacillus absianus]
MGKYQSDAKKLLDEIGGSANISSFTHCATRMRFVLNDDDKANKKAIEDIPSVRGMFTNAGQFQVIIGNEVPDFYNDFVDVAGMVGGSKEDAKAAAKAHQNPVQKAIATLAEIFTPLLPAIIVGGLILGFRNILEGVQFGGSTIVQQSQFWSGVNAFLWLPGEAIFHFLPVGITWSITKKMKTTQILGIVLGITLVSPQLLNAYAVASTPASKIPFWDFGFAHVNMIGYQAQVIPAMLAGFMLVYLERFFRKYIPQSVSMIFVPFFSLIPTILAAHTILGPIGWKIGDAISAAVNAGLTSQFNWLFGLAFGALYAPVVITGLHHTTLAIDAQLISTYKSTNLWPMIALSNIAQGSATLAVAIAHRGNKKEEQISVPSTISAYLGVTEPAMFGINLKYVYPFVAAMIGSGLAGMFVTIMGVRAYSIGVGGLPGILSIVGQFIPAFAIGMLIAIAVPFVLTFVLRKVKFLNKVEFVDEAAATAPATDVDAQPAAPVAAPDAVTLDTTSVHFDYLYAPVNGDVMPIEAVHDPVFSTKMMGQGFAVHPADGQIHSPVVGTVLSVFETKHAIGIKMDNGLEILVHMGLDTVALHGDPFTVHVEAGDHVTPETLLADMDLDQVVASGKDTDIVVVITNTEKVSEYKLLKAGTHKAGEEVVAVKA